MLSLATSCFTFRLCPHISSNPELSDPTWTLQSSPFPNQLKWQSTQFPQWLPLSCYVTTQCVSLVMNAWNERSNLPTQFPSPSSWLLLLCFDTSCVFLQGEAEWTPPGETEVGGEDYGSVQSPWTQHATFTNQGQVCIYIYVCICCYFLSMNTHMYSHKYRVCVHWVTTVAHVQSSISK